MLQNKVKLTNQREEKQIKNKPAKLYGNEENKCKLKESTTHAIIF